MNVRGWCIPVKGVSHASFQLVPQILPIRIDASNQIGLLRRAC